MALTSAEKQARYRERHLGVDGDRVRIYFVVSVPARAQLGRLARLCGYSVTKMIEELAATAEGHIVDGLDPEARKNYYEGGYTVTGREHQPSLRKFRRTATSRRQFRPVVRIRDVDVSAKPMLA
jgi:hypothetical protein